ncbi:hypothetical protein [Xenorhabdus bovienii]|uniref:hypothetical protein n=1 Tax=Xenorhabdus bovienii TaxID=40576 RepID=UPI00237CA6C8|nr:hypothetical protein [Xenorhabdus bovienii]MDE1483437.1 hypothetical protein [Xenorhabdus bovienii]
MQQGRGGGGKTGGRRPTSLQGLFAKDCLRSKQQKASTLCATPGDAEQRGRQT